MIRPSVPLCFVLPKFIYILPRNMYIPPPPPKRGGPLKRRLLPSLFEPVLYPVAWQAMALNLPLVTAYNMKYSLPNSEILETFHI